MDAHTKVKDTQHGRQCFLQINFSRKLVRKINLFRGAFHEYRRAVTFHINQVNAFSHWVNAMRPDRSVPIINISHKLDQNEHFIFSYTALC